METARLHEGEAQNGVELLHPSLLFGANRRASARVDERSGAGAGGLAGAHVWSLTYPGTQEEKCGLITVKYACSCVKACGGCG